MNTEIFKQEQKLRQALENKLSFGITDTAILDLIDEHKITITATSAGFTANADNRQPETEISSRIAVMKILLQGP